ncbi:MAG: hypothetical protein JNK77_18705 [Saprospiraceae bacterium]|nr:hypothetical protein [Saprospiraceae bacterium]
MTPGIALSTDKSTLYYIDSNGNKTDIDLLNGNAAKVSLSGGNVSAIQVTSVPSGGTVTEMPLSLHLQVSYNASKSRSIIFGSDDVDSSMVIHVHPTDLTRHALYLENDGTNLVVTEG